MTKLATLTGHTLRVLYLAVSPDGQTIVTGAGEPPILNTVDCCKCFHTLYCTSIDKQHCFARLTIQGKELFLAELITRYCQLQIVLTSAHRHSSL